MTTYPGFAPPVAEGLLDLPSTALANICKHLDGVGLCCLARTCTKCFDMAGEDYFWPTHTTDGPVITSIRSCLSSVLRLPPQVFKVDLDTKRSRKFLISIPLHNLRKILGVMDTESLASSTAAKIQGLADQVAVDLRSSHEHCSPAGVILACRGDQSLVRVALRPSVTVQIVLRHLNRFPDPISQTVGVPRGADDGVQVTVARTRSLSLDGLPSGETRPVLRRPADMADMEGNDGTSWHPGNFDGGATPVTGDYRVEGREEAGGSGSDLSRVYVEEPTGLRVRYWMTASASERYLLDKIKQLRVRCRQDAWERIHAFARQQLNWVQACLATKERLEDEESCKTLESGQDKKSVLSYREYQYFLFSARDVCCKVLEKLLNVQLTSEYEALYVKLVFHDAVPLGPTGRDSSPDEVAICAQNLTWVVATVQAAHKNAVRDALMANGFGGSVLGSDLQGEGGWETNGSDPRQATTAACFDLNVSDVLGASTADDVQLAMLLEKLWPNVQAAIMWSDLFWVRDYLDQVVKEVMGYLTDGSSTDVSRQPGISYLEHHRSLLVNKFSKAIQDYVRCKVSSYKTLTAAMESAQGMENWGKLPVALDVRTRHTLVQWLLCVEAIKVINICLNLLGCL